jgi:hypothetical protein
MCWRTGNTAEASEELLRCFIERVAGYFFHDLALTYGRVLVEEVLHGGVIGGLHLCSKNPFSYRGFFTNRKSFLEGILHSFIAPTKILSRKGVVSVCTPLIVFGFGASVQLVCRDLPFCQSGGGAEEVA